MCNVWYKFYDIYIFVMRVYNLHAHFLLGQLFRGVIIKSMICNKLYLYNIVFVLCCVVLYCIVLYCIELYCIVLHCIVLFCFVLFCFVLYCIVLWLNGWMHWHYSEFHSERWVTGSIPVGGQRKVWGVFIQINIPQFLTSKVFIKIIEYDHEETLDKLMR